MKQIVTMEPIAYSARHRIYTHKGAVSEKRLVINADLHSQQGSIIALINSVRTGHMVLDERYFESIRQYAVSQTQKTVNFISQIRLLLRTE